MDTFDSHRSKILFLSSCAPSCLSCILAKPLKQGSLHAREACTNIQNLILQMQSWQRQFNALTALLLGSTMASSCPSSITARLSPVATASHDGWTTAKEERDKTRSVGRGNWTTAEQ